MTACPLPLSFYYIRVLLISYNNIIYIELVRLLTCQDRFCHGSALVPSSEATITACQRNLPKLATTVRSKTVVIWFGSGFFPGLATGLLNTSWTGR